jgi:hypothetical protein
MGFEPAKLPGLAGWFSLSIYIVQQKPVIICKCVRRGSLAQ